MPSPPPASNSSGPSKQHRASSASSTSSSDEEFHDARFPLEEEAALLSESNDLKSQANTLFGSSAFTEALSTYDRALSSCPNYLDFEIAVLQSNISACYIKLEEWKDAVEAATRSLDHLEILDPLPKEAKEAKDKNDRKKPRRKANTKETTSNGAATNSEDNAVVELSGSDDEAITASLTKLQLSDTRKAEINRIRAKSLLRRARSRLELDGWSNLAAAQEDYLFLSQRLPPDTLPPSDKRTVQAALRDLPAKLDRAKEKEMGEMMGKLKDLGNGILKPFGLSTENFKMVKDEKTGGYSMSFEK